MIRKITIAAALATPLVYFVLANHESSGPILNEPAIPLAALTVGSPHEPTPAGGDDTEIVLGIPVLKDRDCQIELKDYVTTRGEMFSAYSCTPNNAATAHAYADYDNATLANMAYFDADAAALLGHRLIDRDTGRSYELLIRASALEGGNVEHLAWLADQAFGTVAIDGEPLLGNLQRQYELAALANRLGDGPGKAGYLKHELVRNGIDEARLDALNLRVNALLQSMRKIQRTVLGEVTIGGRDDA